MLQFVREIPLRIVLQGTPSSRRGFLFHLAAGFAPKSGTVDPLSGMSVNLMAVDAWLGELKKELEESVFTSPTESLNHALAEVMAVTRLRLAELAESENVMLGSLYFREERGWSYSWDLHQSPEEQRFTYSHYLEFLPKTKPFRLLRFDLSWQRQHSCEADYQHEGFKLMKTLRGATLEELLSQAAQFKGRVVGAGTRLTSVELHDLSGGFSLQL